MEPLTFIFFLFLTAFCFAKVEIAVEGKYGWAAKLPTWKLPRTNWASLIFFSGKPATGYHVWLEVFLIAFLHVIYVFVEPTWHIELQIFAFFFFFSVLEDFLWFVLNPAFGIKNFRRKKIWWHKEHWWLIAPRDYFIFLSLGGFLYWLSTTL